MLDIAITTNNAKKQCRNRSVHGYNLLYNVYRVMLVSNIIQSVRHTDIQKLAACLPARLIQSKAPKTVDKYSRAFMEFKTWTARYGELEALPSSPSTVSLFLEYCVQNNCPFSAIESVFNGINWAHNLHGFDSP